MKLNAGRGAGVWSALLLLYVLPVGAQDMRLTVRPHEMATAPRTERAGDFTLDSLPGYLVHVPQQCVGTRRCPLVVYLPGGGWKATWALERSYYHMAAKYGFVVLARDWTQMYEGPGLNLDAALKQVLRRFVIDPDKIAVIGHCAGGQPAIRWGSENFNVFSRIIAISTVPSSLDVTQVPPPPPDKAPQFFLNAGLYESHKNILAAEQLRQAGHSVKLFVALRNHGQRLDDDLVMARWLHESWATPNPAARAGPKIIPDPVAVLTTEMLAQMSDFWTRFMQEPDSVLMGARLAHQQEVVVPVLEYRPSVVMMDMPALAGKAPSVAAALKAAGLTAEQHDAYRVALLSTLLGRELASKAGEELAAPIKEAPVLGRNLTFMSTHSGEFHKLERAGVDPAENLGNHPKVAADATIEEIARSQLRGIWHTP